MHYLALWNQNHQYCITYEVFVTNVLKLHALLGRCDRNHQHRITCEWSLRCQIFCEKWAIQIFCEKSSRRRDVTHFWRASIKPGRWNIPEHPGTFRNIPEHGIIIIIMRKICEIKFSTTKWNKIELVSAWKIKEKKQAKKKPQKHNKTNSNWRKKRKLKMYALSEGWQLTNNSKTNPFLLVMFAINLIAWPSLIPNFVVHRKPRWWRSNSLIRLWFHYSIH